MAWPEPVTLASPHARLEPLSDTHHDALCAAARDGELWKLGRTAVHSITAAEWPSVRSHLDWQLDKPR